MGQVMIYFEYKIEPPGCVTVTCPTVDQTSRRFCFVLGGIEMKFADDVPIGTQLDILSSRIRMKKRAIELELRKRNNIEIAIGEMRVDLAVLEGQFDKLVIESGRTRSEG